MPELPEVEVLRLSLLPLLVGQELRAVAVHARALREPLDRRALMATVGRRVVGLRRRGKYLLIDLSGDLTLVVHLGMSGRLTVVSRAEPRARHEHLAWGLGSGSRLRLVDPRRFGLAFVAATSSLARDPHFAGLGVEPLSPEFDGAVLSALARGRRAPVKAFLLDGRAVVGVGNIYASEALHLARLHPQRPVDRIPERRWQELAAAVVAVLERAIAEGGTTLNDFANGAGEPGLHQISLGVYGREGEACSSCRRRIRRLVQSGRSTYFCPRCQR